jgi:hypothetical protein
MDDKTNPWDHQPYGREQFFSIRSPFSDAIFSSNTSNGKLGGYNCDFTHILELVKSANMEPILK